MTMRMTGAQEEFEKHVVKECADKGPLLTGDLQVRLKEGVAKLGELTINDNSNWMRCKTFRIGVKVASECSWNIRIREGKTNAIRVREKRSAEFEKHHPPALGDDVWRLVEIAKKGEYHERLSKEGIHKVKDFLFQLSADSEKLAQILGMSITSKKWSRLVNHAKTCETNYLHYPDGTGERGAIFNFGHHIGIIEDRVHVATHRLSAQQKEHGNTIVEKAFHNWKDVRELNGEIISESMQKKSSSSFLSQVPGGQIDNVTLVRPNLDPGTYVAPTGPEAPLANPGSTDERHNGVSALPSPVQSENTYFGNAIGISVDESVVVAHQPESTYCSNFPISAGDNGLTPVRLQIQSNDTSLRYATGSPRIYPSSQRDYAVNEHVPPSEPTSASMPGVQSSGALPDSEGNPMMEGHNGVTLALPVRSQVANFGNAWKHSVDYTFHPAGHQPISTDGSAVLFSPGDKRDANVKLPILAHDINPQCALPSQMIGSSSQMVDGNVPFSEPPHTSIPSFQSSSAFPPLEDDRVMAGIQPTIPDDGWWTEIFATDDTTPDADTFPDDAV